MWSKIVAIVDVTLEGELTISVKKLELNVFKYFLLLKGKVALKVFKFKAPRIKHFLCFMFNLVIVQQLAKLVCISSWMTIRNAYDIINFSVRASNFHLNVFATCKIEESVNCLQQVRNIYANTTSIWININMQKSKTSILNDRFISNFCFSKCNNVRLKS